MFNNSCQKVSSFLQLEPDIFSKNWRLMLIKLSLEMTHQMNPDKKLSAPRHACCSLVETKLQGPSNSICHDSHVM